MAKKREKFPESGTVAARMALPPLPIRTEDGVQVRKRRRPTKNFLGFRCVGYQLRGIAGARRFDARGNRPARNFLRGFDEFQNRKAVAGSEVYEVGLAAAAQIVERENVGIGQVGHMNV